MKDLKSIQFPPPVSDNMIRALLLEGRKTVTRRLVKPQPRAIYYDGKVYDDDGLYVVAENQNGRVEQIELPYCPGDVLYVRETFCLCCLSENYRKGHSDYCYKASVKSPVYGCIDHFMGGEQMRSVSGCRWHPSIHMPREAARIFLRVTDVRVERLKEITLEQAMKEGVIDPEHRPYIQYEQVGQLERYARNKVFPEIWDSTIKTADRAIYGWAANPWVWVIEFERCEKPEEV